MAQKTVQSLTRTVGAIDEVWNQNARISEIVVDDSSFSSSTENLGCKDTILQRNNCIEYDNENVRFKQNPLIQITVKEKCLATGLASFAV